MIEQADFLQHITARHFFDDHQKVLIAVSGGVDSMNLLHFLYVSRETININIGIVHVNHQQRPESKEEETYLRKWAEEHHLPFYVAYFEGKFSEKKARDFRYAFFKAIMQEEGYTALVTAHHADDQAETIFMRFMRGSKLRYQSGIKERQFFGPGELIRPLLSFSKADLPKLYHFEDESNYSNHYLRNRVRNSYFPQLEKENSDIVGALLRHGQEVGELIQALKDLTQDLEKQNCHVFQQQTFSVQRFLLEDYLSEIPDLQLGQRQFEQLLAHLNTSKNYHYPLKNGYYFLKQHNRFDICKIGPRTDGQQDSVLLQYGASVLLEQYMLTYDESQLPGAMVIPLKDLTPVTVRHRQAGDRVRVRGINKKLRRFFIDEKIPNDKRRETLIFEQKEQVIAVLCDGKTYLSNPDYHDIMRGKLYIQKV